MKIQIADKFIISSESSGASRGHMLSKLVDASGAKSASIYVLVHETDADTDIDVVWGHSPQPPNFVQEATAMFSESGVSVGMTASTSTTDVTRCDLLQFGVDISKGTPTAQVTATVSVWVVLEPF